jgi:hypothetical protein
MASLHACLPKLQVCLVPVLKPVINYKVFSFKVCVNWTWLGPAWDFLGSIENPGDLKCEEPDPDPISKILELKPKWVISNGTNLLELGPERLRFY